MTNYGATFKKVSSSPTIYSGYVNSTGYFSAPSDSYFGGDLTITAFVYVQTIQYWGRLIDFGIGSGTDNILFALSFGSSGQPILQIYSNTNYDGNNVYSPTAIPNTQWTHLAVILKGTNSSIYLNCTYTCSKNSNYVPRNVVRVNNYIGKSNWGGDSNADARFRNLRIYNRALSQSELKADFNYQ